MFQSSSRLPPPPDRARVSTSSSSFMTTAATAQSCYTTTPSQYTCIGTCFHYQLALRGDARGPHANGVPVLSWLVLAGRACEIRRSATH